MSRLVMLLALTTGCAAPALNVRIKDAWTGDPIMEQRDYIDEACEILGVECVQVDYERGAVTVQMLSEVGNGIRGSVLGRKNTRGCRRYAFSQRDGRVLAHELGHALIGLGHRSDPDYLMHGSSDGTALYDWEIEKMERSMRMLDLCSPAG